MTFRDLKRKLSFTKRVIYINHKYPVGRDPVSLELIYSDQKIKAFVIKVTEHYFDLLPDNEISSIYKNIEPLRFDFPKRELIEFDKNKFTILDQNKQKTITIVFL